MITFQRESHILVFCAPPERAGGAPSPLRKQKKQGGAKKIVSGPIFLFCSPLNRQGVPPSSQRFFCHPSREGGPSSPGEQKKQGGAKKTFRALRVFFDPPSKRRGATKKTLPISYRKESLIRLRKAIHGHEDEIIEALYKDLKKPKLEAYASEIGVEAYPEFK